MLLLSANSAGAAEVPPGFKLVFQKKGVALYQHSLANSKAEYVTIVNLKKARITNIIGQVSVDTNSKLERKNLLDFWDDAARLNSANSKLKVLVNGAFFSQKLDPTPIAFGLKTNGNIVTYGYGLDEFPGLIRILGFDRQQAWIANYKNRQSFQRITSNLIGGLDIIANKSADKYLPRTFAGIKDRDRNGWWKTVIFYSSNAARQRDAVRVLDSFGANKKIMLDGGSSTGLIVNRVNYIKANRTIPHAIAIYAGK